MIGCGRSLGPSVAPVLRDDDVPDCAGHHQLLAVERSHFLRPSSVEGLATCDAQHRVRTSCPFYVLVALRDFLAARSVSSFVCSFADHFGRPSSRTFSLYVQDDDGILFVYVSVPRLGSVTGWLAPPQNFHTGILCTGSALQIQSGLAMPQFLNSEIANR